MEKVRYGIIGIGGIGKTHLEAALQDNRVELTALADSNADAVKHPASKFGVRAFTDYRDMLDADIVDAVSIASPHFLHGLIGLQCLKAGVHTFIEKPLALRVSEADALLSVARKKKLKICVGHQYRFNHTSQRLKQLLDKGTIGRVNHILWTMFELRSEAYYRDKPWSATWKDSGGGVLLNQASHHLDLLCWLFGVPQEVVAVIGNQYHRAEIEDVACVNAVFPQGATGEFFFTVNQPNVLNVRHISGERGIILMHNVHSLDVDQDHVIRLGIFDQPLQTSIESSMHSVPAVKIQWKTLGASRVKSALVEFISGLPRQRKIWRLIRKSETVLRRSAGVQPKPAKGHAGLMKSFIDAILHDGEPSVSGESALGAVEMINAAILSAVKKKHVSIPVDREEFDALFKKLASGKVAIPRFR